MQNVPYAEFIAARRRAICERIDAAARLSGRDTSSVKLIAVSKTVGAPELVAAMEAGYDAFGENRPQELSRKLAALEELAAAEPDKTLVLSSNSDQHVELLEGLIDRKFDSPDEQ